MFTNTPPIVSATTEEQNEAASANAPLRIALSSIESNQRLVHPHDPGGAGARSSSSEIKPLVKLLQFFFFYLLIRSW